MKPRYQPLRVTEDQNQPQRIAWLTSTGQQHEPPRTDSHATHTLSADQSRKGATVHPSIVVAVHDQSGESSVTTQPQAQPNIKQTEGRDQVEAADMEEEPPIPKGAFLALALAMFSNAANVSVHVVHLRLLERVR